MSGQDMLTFVDLSRATVERHPPLLRWVRTWTDLPKLEPLTPEGWFKEGHGIRGAQLDRCKVWMPIHEPKNKLHLWAPQPPVTDAALEELLKARHKRTHIFHVVLILRLMTLRWRCLFNKACDFTFVVSTGASFWPKNMSAPLWVGILLPFSIHRPWCLKRVPLLVEMGRDLREVLSEGIRNGGLNLRKLLKLPGLVASMSANVAYGVLHLLGRAPHFSNNDRRRRAGKSVAQGRGKAKED